MSDRDERRADDALLDAERDLDALLELSRSLTETGDIQGAFFRIAELLADVLDSDRCSIIVLEPGPKTTGHIVAASDDPNIQDLTIDLDVYPEVREAIRTTAPVIVDDVHRAPLFDEVRDRIKNKPVGSTILFPVAIDRNVRCVLHLRTEHTRERRLTPREIRFGRIVANATGIALRNARLYESVRDRSERRLNERIRAERRLRQTEKYQRFFDFAGDGLMIIDGTGRILFANRASRMILGFDEDDMSRIRLADIVQDETADVLGKIMTAVRERKHAHALDLTVLRADGERVVLSITTAPLEDEDELPEIVERRRRPSSSSDLARDSAAIVSFRDVTDTRVMELELRRTKDFLTNLIASSADAIVAADMDGRIIIFNPAAVAISGWTETDILGKNVSLMYPAGVAQAIMVELRSKDHGGSGKLTERRQQMLTKEGQLVPVNLAAAIVYDRGQEVATVGIFSDLRERLQLETELTRAQRKLELTERQSAVAELAGAAAHELNQPLTSIIGTIELMQRKVARGGSVTDYLDTLLPEADRMAEIVKKLGRITRYRSKRYVGDTDILDIDAAARETEDLE